MMRWLWILAAVLCLGVFKSAAQTDSISLVQRHWFETRTAHFNLYSCSPPLEVNKLAARLEQFAEAYSLLAGTQALVSPPIVVMAFPDEDAMKPFLPLYNGKPGNLAGFFKRGNDENLIVLAMQGTNSAHTDLNVIFHEYTHLLLRRNDRFWPLWLKEGMAEMYSTFEPAGEYTARIGEPIDHHLELLAHEPFMPLAELFAVKPDSPQYNERERQGIFYAESWLLTHFLMAGDNADFKERFGQFTTLLRAGQPPVQAFVNALQTTLPVMQNELQRYLERGNFTPITLTLPLSIDAPKLLGMRAVTPVEVYFRLGDEQLRINRLPEAQWYFEQAQKLAPASPLPYEGLGLIAVERDQPDEAVREFTESRNRGSESFLVYFDSARERYQLTADARGRYAPLKDDAAAEIRGELQKSISLSPNFAPAHELLGFLELVQGENLVAAEQQLHAAIQLDPDNPAYQFSLAEVQLRNQNLDAARRTLQPLLLPYIEAEIRTNAAQMILEISQHQSSR
jgi:tetratricopeptide (TPR) repeat protein